MNVLTNTSCRVVKDVVKRLQSSSTTVSSIDIKIPARIERGPTDILKALDKTITRDPSAPHYKYHDDPYLIPLSKQEQRFRALSLESGKKAAMWVYREHADLFARELADPIIPDFLPPAVYTQKDQVSEEILLKTISQGKTLDALKIYNLLDEDVSIKAKQSLLELLCFSNSKDLPQFALPEERWFKSDVVPKKTCVWNETGEINKLSKFLMSQDNETAAAAYNALICGKAKYLQTNEAWSLYLKCVEDKIPLNVYAYNAIISIIPLVIGPLQDPSREVFKLLKEMSINKIRPNVRTLNAALERIYSFTSFQYAMKFIHNVLGEFKVAGVKPSLASYYHILFAASRDGKSAISALSDILDVLEKDTIQFHDPNDIKFFPIAIEVAKQQLNREMGERVHALLQKDDNYQFINNSISENIYYRNYLLLNIATLPLEEFFELYYNLTTNIYIPEALVLENIFKTIQQQSNDVILKHLPQLWSQVQVYNMLDVDRVIRLALHITCSCDLESESPLHETFAKCAMNIWNHKQMKVSNIRQPVWDATILGNIILLVLRASWYEEALNIISFMIHKEAFVMGVLNSKDLDKLLEICILHGYGPIALNLIKYASISGAQDAAVMARKAYNVIPFNAAEKEELISLVGHDVLQLQLSDEH